MALEFPDSSPRRWFGFSPAVVVLAVVVVLGGGSVVRFSSGSASPDPYTAALTKLCADFQAMQTSDSKAEEAAWRANPTGPVTETLFQKLSRYSHYRIDKLDQVAPPPDRIAFQRELIDLESQVITASDTWQAGYAQTGRYDGASETLLTVMPILKKADALYSSLGIPKGCAD